MPEQSLDGSVVFEKEAVQRSLGIEFKGTEPRLCSNLRAGVTSKCLCFVTLALRMFYCRKRVARKALNCIFCKVEIGDLHLYH